jgi:hypothetical protein
MKNKLPFLLTLVFTTIISIWVINADSILDFLDYAEAQQWTYGYTSRDWLTIVNITNSYIDIDSPIIKNWTQDISSYLFVASTERAQRNPVAYWCFDNVTMNWNKFSVSLSTTALNASDIYYIYATPLDSITWVYNWSCTASDASQFLQLAYSAWNDSTANWSDPCVIIQDKFYWEWKDCENHKNPWSTNIYSITWVSHVYDWNNIKLTWNSYSSVNLDIFLWDESRWSFVGLGSVNSDQRSFTFTKRHDWDHIVKIRPSDGSQEINYTAHYKETPTPQVTPTTPVKPVVVWPKENIMIILFGTLILYVVYRFATRKRS